MQFVLSCDSARNYKILYADNNTEALEAAKQISVPSDLDGKGVFGYRSLGKNGEKALLYKLARDPASPADSYYIHGIIRDASEDYYAERLSDDLLYLFIKSDWLSANHDIEAEAPPAKQDPELTAMLGEQLYMNDSVFTTVLARLYSGDSVTLCVSDRIYSPAYARRLMHRLYSFMPPALRRECGFAAGTALDGDMKVRILPLSVGAEVEGIKLELNDPLSEGEEIPVFSEAARDIYATGSRSPEEIAELLAVYHTVCRGDISRYEPQRFADFVEAYRKKDTQLTDSFLEEYLSKTEDPSPEGIPAFVTEVLSPQGAPAALAVENVSAMLDAAGVLDRNSVALKKMYVTDKSQIDSAVAPLYGNFKTVPLSARTAGKIKEGINAYISVSASEHPAYAKCFYAALEPYFTLLSERVARHEGYIESLRNAKESFLSTMERSAVTDAFIAKERRRFFDGCKVLLPEAEKNGSDLREDIDAVFTECLEEYKVLNPAEGEDKKNDAEDAKRLADELLSQLDGFYTEASGELARLTRRLDDICKSLEGHAPTANRMIADFILRTAENGGATLPPAVSEAISQGHRVLDISILIARTDVCAALLFAAKYADYAQVYNVLGKLISACESLINSLGVMSANNCIRAVCRELCDRAYNAYIVPDSGYSYGKLKGNSRSFAASVEKTRRNVAAKKMTPAIVKCSDGSRLIVAIIVMALIIILGACGVLLAIETGLLDGDIASWFSLASEAPQKALISLSEIFGSHFHMI